MAKRDNVMAKAGKIDKNILGGIGMSATRIILQAQNDGTLSFGDYKLIHKTKQDDFEFEGDIYKAKTFHEMTKLEKNDMFIYESVPGSKVDFFKATGMGVTFSVTSFEDIQCILELEPNQSYEVMIEGVLIGEMTTGVSGKLVFGIELTPDVPTEVKITEKI